jgi:DNA polymerase-1
MDKPKLILIDGSSYLYRAFYVPQLKRMSNAQGEPTGAVFGTINMIKSLQAEYPDATLVAVFDAKGKTFRHDMYDQYKANRPPMPDELRSQVEFVHRSIVALGIPLIMESGVEADDVLGSYATQATSQGLDVLIASGDKDLAQLVTPHVNLIDTMKKVIYDEAGVKEKYGVAPEQIIDYLTLIGDTSDNIPGVPKVGPKTAVKWLEQFGSLEEIIANADSIGGKVGENLRDFLPELPLSRDLVTIKLDVPLPTQITGLQNQAPDMETLVEIYQALNFKKWLGELGVEAASAVPTATPTEYKKGNYQVIFTEQDFQLWVDRLSQAEAFAFDTETTSVFAQQAELVGVSFAIDEGEAAYVPVAHDYEGAPAQLSLDYVLAALKPILENPSIAIIGQNLKYDMSVLARYEVKIKGTLFDTMLESYVLNSVSGRHDMDSLSERFLGHTPISFSDIAGKGKAQKTFNQIDIEQGGEYAAEDADITLRLHHAIMAELIRVPSLHRVFTEIEMPLVPILSGIEDKGVLIDDNMLLQQSQGLAADMQRIEMQTFEMAGGDFNLSSPKQIQEVLFERLQLPVLRKTPKGQPSTAEDVLQELANDHEMPRLILEHRSLGKLKSTYTDKLPMMINSQTGRVHTSYHQGVTATGRLSSSDPNLQNIPIRTEQGRRIREAFIAPAGRKILAADYSQVELRIMAHLSKDENLISAFQQGRDIHTATAAEIFGLSEDQVESEQRRHAKAVNFGLIYGMSAFGLAKQIDVARGQAQEYIDQYFARYPKVREYMDNTREFAREKGYVETVFGRRLYLPSINAKNHQEKQYAERTAINAPMQGTAADIIKMAMIKVADWANQKSDEISVLMQVHDELVFEVNDASTDSCATRIQQIMQGVAELDVPLIVDYGIADSWAFAH